MITIALADDYTPSRELIKKNIERQGNSLYKIVIEAINGQELIQKLLLSKDLPDITFVDINMPQMDGLAVTAYLTKRLNNIKIIGLSQYEGKQLALEMFHEGAKGYLTKADFPFIFNDAIADIMNGNIYIDEAIDIQPDTIKKYNEEKDNSIDNFSLLTETEKEFLHLNATDLKYPDVALLMDVDEPTILSYFDTLCKKLNLKDRQSLALFAIRHGYAKLAKYYN
ncbi:response regulator [Chitinophagaceae bacterium LWZ2-11]